MSGSNTLDKFRLPSAGTVNCQTCSSSLRLRGHAQTRYIACQSCRKLHSLTENKLQEVNQFDSKFKISPSIPIGTRGKINDILFEIVGFVRWQESGTSYFWVEYILFNPLHGYASLTEYNGHWNYIYQTYDYPRAENLGRTFQHNNAEYRLFLKYKSKAVYAAGEFHYNITDADPTQIDEFVCAPEMYIREKNSKSAEWFKGEYLEPSAIKRAFNIQSLPERIGVGSTQTLSANYTFSALMEVTLAFAVLVVTVQFLLSIFAKEEVVYNNSFTIPGESSSQTIITPSFPVKSGAIGTSNLEFNLTSNLSNEWLSLNISLVNDKTGESIDFEEGVEYYEGYEGGEHWTEGSKQEDKLISSLPDGNYHMNIFVSKPSTYSYSTFNLKVIRDVPMWSNFFIILLLSAIWPALQYWREYSFDKDRWMNSDYSPYDYE